MSGMKRRVWLLALPVALTATTLTSALAAGGSQAADGAAPPQTSAVVDLMARQVVLVASVERMIGTKPVDQQYAIAGFGGVTIDPATNRISLFWKGTPPATVTAERLSPPAGVTITVAAAKYTRAELRAAHLKVVNTSGQDAAVVTNSGATVSRIGPAADGSALLVSYADAGASAGAAKLTATQRAAKTQAVGATVERTSGVVTTTSYEPLAQPMAGNRQNPVSPYYGGSATKSPTGRYCSIGFAVRRISDGRAAAVTADHCGNYATSGYFRELDTVSATGTRTPGPVIGSIGAHNKNMDATVVFSPTGVTTGGRIWSGPYNSSENRAISGLSSNIVGGFVCTSGAATGLRCPLVTDLIRIKAINGSVRTSDNVMHVGSMVTATRTTGPAVGNGDSGGPVWVPNGVRAAGVGMIVASGAATAPCGVTIAVSPAVCYRTVYYVELRPVLSGLGLSLLTSAS